MLRRFLPTQARHTTLLALSLITLALSGCHEPTPAGDGDAHDHEHGTFTFTVSDLTQHIHVDEPFGLTVTVSSDEGTETDHAGAHWSSTSTADADPATLTPDDFEGASPHTSTQVPGQYQITGWTFDDAGTYYFRTHIIHDGDHFWGDEVMIEVVTPVTIEAKDTPTGLQAGVGFDVEVAVEGDGTFSGSTDHAGAHWSHNSTADMDPLTLTPDDFDGASPHTTAEIPGNYTIEGWTFDEAGTYYFRTHLIIEGEHHWGDEVMIEVA